MSELLDAAIEEIDRVLIGNKDRHTEEVYLKNAIRYIREYDSQPQLNPNQQIVLDWLKSTWIDRKKNCWFPFEVINSLYYQFDVAWGKVSYEEFKRIEKDKPYIKAYGELTALEQFEVLELFSKWALEQGEE